MSDTDRTYTGSPLGGASAQGFNQAYNTQANADLANQYEARRLRESALNAALSVHHKEIALSADTLLETARKIETYLKGGMPDKT